MAWVMSVLGAVLALGGGYTLWNGSGYIRLDWGQTETVAGTVALSAGIVTIGLAAVLFALRDLARAPAQNAAAGTALDAAPLDGAAAPQAPRRGRLKAKLATVGLPKAERIEPAAETPAPGLPLPGRDTDEPFAEPLAAEPPQRFASAPADAGLSPVPDAPRPGAAPMAEAPTVVGRYEANGASYVLFSDGTIEVETHDGTHRFDSMAHLREHIESQDAG